MQLSATTPFLRVLPAYLVDLVALHLHKFLLSCLTRLKARCSDRDGKHVTAAATTLYLPVCICPIGSKLAPVLVMLNQICGSLPTERDSNVYTLGEIDKHNVVLVVRPDIGNDAAVTAAMQRLNDFFLIRFGLLIIIRGGVPRKEEDRNTRLRDVVVG